MDKRQTGCLISVVILLAWVSVALADTVPEEAKRYMARGMAAVEMAKTPKDYERAVREFEQAAKLAPNWPDVYSNLGSVQAKAGNYGEAMRHYKRYLELAPNAPDAAKVREEIYKLEYRVEQENLKKDLRKGRGRFSLEDGVIYDSQLGLEWAPSDGQVLNHYQAEGYARDLSLAGGGWRLPTREELKSLYDKSKPGNVDPVFGVGDMWVWTSEFPPREENIPGSVACGFYFYDGGEKAGDRDNIKRNDNRRALAVRSGQSIVDSEKASAASRIAAAQSGDISGTVTDADGNVYQTVKIGNQVWTVENLRTTKYDDGTPIPLVTDSAAWKALTTPGYCYYDNATDADFIKKYGALYNWYVVNTKKLAPKGWHVPTEAEWDTLQNYLIANGYNWDGTTTDNKIAKSMAAKTDWKIIRSTTPGGIDNDLSKNNRSGFSALPGGLRGSVGSVSVFGNIGRGGWWWSATETDASRADSRSLDGGLGKLFRSSRGGPKSSGYSVRLLRD